MRDNYRDYVTYHELAECRSLPEALVLVDGRRRALGARSGAENVPNATLRTAERFDLDAVVMAVSFNSRAWTGL
jgi:hypothetical protein